MCTEAKGTVLKKKVGLILRRLEIQPRTTDMPGGSSLQERIEVMNFIRQERRMFDGTRHYMERERERERE
jgi:hypothetical protein